MIRTNLLGVTHGDTHHCISPQAYRVCDSISEHMVFRHEALTFTSSLPAY